MFNDQADHDNDMSSRGKGEIGSEINHKSDNLSLPLGVGAGFTADETIDPLAGAESGSRINTGALLIVAVVVIAVGGLFAMRTLARMTSVAMADTGTEEKINAFLSVVTGEGMPGGQSKSSVLIERNHTALDVLSEPYTDRQVALNDVQRNPFVINESKATTPEPVRPVVVDDTEQRRQQAQQEIRTRFEQGANRLRVTSTMLGSTPLAYINGEIYQTGEVIYVEQEDVSFKVMEILSNSVRLLAEDRALHVSYPVTINIQIK